MNALPLDGVVVVALEQAVAAPFATRQLGDLGARVIKIERPGTGDFARAYDETVHGQSSHFVWLNRNKESIALDLKDEADRAVAAGLVAKADVFVQNLAPGASARLGLDAETVRAGNPGLIVCTISGYGSSGPYREKKAYDLLVQCEAGVVSLTGTPDAPAKAGIPVADIAAGMYAYSGILAALYERERTGAGASLEVSMLDSLAEWAGFPYYFANYGGTPPPRNGAKHAAIAPYGPYTVDDGVVFIGVQNEREWVALCEKVLGRPELAERFAGNTARVANDAELTAIIEGVLANVPAAEVESRLDAAGIANARMRTMAEFAEHPQFAARDRWRRVGTPAGEVSALMPPGVPPGREPRMDPVPALGQHSAAIRAEFGRS
ncbi:CaiB/BaiF CoA-transferase family protein [Amycolatopsis minnesotensis]|uniref:CaiB/BaiF CoA-transferase family protein n=1 Tax=Amycolatopsis minnesotensis TaxID=337894 RepID=A0ABN2QNP3_9PSEU